MVPKHFPFSKFIRSMLAGTLRDPNEEYKGNFYSRLNASLNIPNSNICETRLYFEFTATNRMSGKKSLGRDIWTQSWRSWLFLAFFFSFSNITFEIFILEESFCQHKCRAHQAASFPIFGMSLR